MLIQPQINQNQSYFDKSSENDDLNLDVSTK
jgi:hypothetical protein